MNLEPIENSELTPYVINLLSGQNINTVLDFLRTDFEKLSKITNLSKCNVINLRNKLKSIYLPTAKRLSDCRLLLNCEIYGFGIKALDAALSSAETLANGRVFEIYGVPAIGKTQFCHSVIINFLKDQRDVKALYIDTKLDFSATRLFQMLKARNISRNETGHIAQRVIVERCFDAYGAMKILECFLKQLNKNDVNISKIKFVVIDSVPAVFFQHTSHEEKERLEGKYLLSKLANLIYKIANNYGIAFLLVNLAVPQKDFFSEENVENCRQIEEIPNEDGARCSSRASSVDSIHGQMQRIPALGRHWRRMPRVRLLMRTRSEDDEHPTDRSIEIVKSCYSATGSYCFVKIIDAGVVDDPIATI